MQDAEKPNERIPAWRVQQTTPAHQLKQRSPLARLGKATVDAISTAIEAALLLGVSHLPENWCYALAPHLGSALRAGVRGQTLANLQLFLGESSRTAVQWDALWALHKRHIGITTIESLKLGTTSKERIRAQVSVEGEEHLAGALKAGRGAMLFISHLGNIGAVAAALGTRGYDISITGNAMPRPYIEKRVSQIHQYLGAHRLLIGEQLPFKAARVFRRNGVFASFIDYTVVEQLNHWLPFGSAELNTNIGPALIAQRSGVPILYVSCRPLPKVGHCLSIHPPFEYNLTGERTTDAIAVTQVAISRLAQEILERPEQWWPWDWAELRPRPATRLDTAPTALGA